MVSVVDIGWTGFALRFAAGLILVFSTYNPEGLSYYHWVSKTFPALSAVQTFSGVLLVVGWAVYFRAAMRSLGIIGMTLATGFFGALIWVVIDTGLIPADSTRALTHLLLLLMALVLSTGLSWSHVRRRLSGQMDTDDV